MNEFEKSLPPLLERQLTEVLVRYRRLRLLRAAARFSVLLAVALLILGISLWLGAPLAVALTLVALLALGAAGYCFGPVLIHPAEMREIAMHIDRHYPALHDSLLSAVSMTGNAENIPSAWMLENFLADTQRNVKGVALDSFINSREYRMLVGAVSVCGAVLVVGGLIAIWNLGYIRSAANGETVAGLISFTVEPGNVVVQPGENQIIWVTSPDTHATRHIFWEQNGIAQRAVMSASSTPEVAFHTFQSLQDHVRYQVRVGTSASAWFEIKVSRPPAIESIQLEYEYPAYLGMTPKVVPFGGDIAAVEGTHVTVRVETNKVLAAATFVRNGGEEVPLVPVGETLWETELTLDSSGTYYIALLDEAGERNPVPEEFDIDVQPDNPPAIRVRFPRGDSEVLPLEEVPFAFEVEDDFGIADYGIEYAIAGREPVRLALNNGSDLAQQIAGDHLLALEGMGLNGGDLITWTVWATDKKPNRESYEVTGDPFFLEVRPYVRRYRELISNGGGAAGQQAGQDLLEAQRNVVVALHNLRKESRTLQEEAYGERRTRIGDAQTDVITRLSESIGRAAPEQQAIGREALQAMEDVGAALVSAIWPIPDKGLGEGYGSAQRALQLMLKLEPDLRTVARTQGQGGGGGGGGGAQEEIDALEMSKRKDYQEDARTGAEEAAANEELRKALDDLARRQEILNDDLGKLLSEDEKSLDELERQRRLERLQEEQARQLERLDALANQLNQSGMDPEQRQQTREAMDEARRAMESSMESAREERLQQARAAGSRAAQQLAAAESGLDSLTREAARERMAALEEALRGISERHEAISAETQSLKAAQAAPGVAGEPEVIERMEQLKSDKEALARAAEEMLVEAGGLSDQMRENQELLSRKLGDWARRTSRTGVVEEMEESIPWVDWGIWDAVQNSENQVQRKLDVAAESLEALERYLPGDPEDDVARALDMLRGLEPADTSPPGEEESGQASADGDESQSASEQSGAADGEAEGPGEAEAPPGSAGSPDGSSDGAQAARPAESNRGQAGAPASSAPGEGSQDGAPQGEEGLEGSSGGTGANEDESLAANVPADGEAPSGAPGEGAENGPRGTGGGMQSADTSAGGGIRALDEFFGRDASNWRPALRDAAALLPRASEVRGDLEQVEMEIGRMQRAFKNEKKLPDVAEFEQVIRRPLMDSIATLEALIQARESGEQPWLEDEGEVPGQYVDRVAEYFRLLSEQTVAP